MPTVYTVDRKGNGLKFSGGQIVQLNPMPVNLRFQPADAASWSCAFYLSSLSAGLSPLLGWTNTSAVGANLLINPGAGTVLFQFGSDGTTWRNYITLDINLRVGMNYITFSKAATIAVTGMNVYANGSGLGGRVNNQGNLQDIPLDYAISPLQFGKYQTTFLTNCIIYDFTFYNQALTLADHIKYVQSNGANFPIVSFVDRWDFNEKQGTTARSFTGSVANLGGFSSTSLGSGNQWVDNDQNPILV
jgi:hypothetical protein